MQRSLKLKKDISVKIGKLGICNFSKGDYIYTGSANKNIEARVDRHRMKNKKLHWHIDYLLHDKNVELVDVKLFELGEKFTP